MAIRIISTGRAVPETVLTNDELSQLVDTSNEWIISRTGIEKRHIVKNNTDHQTLGAEAAEKAIKSAGIDRQKIGLLVYATFTPDTLVPSLASCVRAKLGIENAVAFDINSACTGFLAATATARGLMTQLGIEYALVFGGELMSRVVDFTDRGTCVLFGDAVGATLLQNSDGEEGIKDIHLQGMNDYGSTLWVGAKYADGPYMKEQEPPYIKMEGPSVYRFATDAMQKELLTITQKNNIDLNEIDFIVPHQANERIIRSVSSRLKLPMEKFVLNMSRYGNTSAASIPVALDELNESGKIERGQNLIFVAFGGGLSTGSILVKW